MSSYAELLKYETMLKMSHWGADLANRMIQVERERCALIAEMPNMAPADIARAIRDGLNPLVEGND